MSTQRLLVLAFGLVTCTAAVAQPLRRAELSFSGTTSASELLIRDVMENVVDLGDDEFDCPMPESVTAEVLSEGFQPPEQEAAPVHGVSG